MSSLVRTTPWLSLALAFLALGCVYDVDGFTSAAASATSEGGPAAPDVGPGAQGEDTLPPSNDDAAPGAVDDTAPAAPLDTGRAAADDVGGPGGHDAADAACSGGLLSCGGACVDVSSDARHCGSCDTACGGGETCHAGKCKGKGGD